MSPNIRLRDRGPWLAQLGGAAPCTPALATACMIDNSLATNYAGKGQSGYNFAIAIINAGQYIATATPITSEAQA
jgi:hypothetical protein